jgi:hypothetical protein
MHKQFRGARFRLVLFAEGARTEIRAGDFGAAIRKDSQSESRELRFMPKHES